MRDEADRLSELLESLDPRVLRYSATRGDAKAQVNLAVHLESTGDSESASTWYRRAAEQGVARAQYNLGVLLYQGRGVSKDHAEAVHWYTKAAEQGYLNAMYNLGFMHEHGLGCEKDFEAAVQQYRQAAEQGEADSQFKMALLLLESADQEKLDAPYRADGWDVTPSSDKALIFLRSASEQGHRLSRQALGELGWAVK